VTDKAYLSCLSWRSRVARIAVPCTGIWYRITALIVKVGMRILQAS